MAAEQEFVRGYYAATALQSSDDEAVGAPLVLPYDHQDTSANHLPTGSAGLGGVLFDFAEAGHNALSCRGQRLTLPQGRYAVLWLVGVADHGAVEASVQVEYADGTVAAAPVTIPDAEHPAGALVAAWDGLHAIYLTAVALDSARDAVAVTLPSEGRARLFAATAEPEAGDGDESVRVVGVGSTDLFIGTEDDPRQVLRVAVANVGISTADASIDVQGEVVTTEPTVIGDLPPGVIITTELGVVRGDTSTAADTARATVAGQEVTVRLAEPGWTMHMVSHFHYDPVWWNTQAAYTESWNSVADPGWIAMQPGITLVKAHLDLARRDPDYKFVLAEIDYLKPYWNHHPEDREYLRQLIREGRLEYVGGTYNEPSPVLTSAELTIRNVIYGIGYQRDVLGGDPQSAWMLDVFGHDPQFPGICAAAGLTSSSWARGPHHEWGPKQLVGTNTRMQFTSEFEWVAPSGQSLLTSYMPNHYSAGWAMDSSPNLGAAMDATYHLHQDLKPVSATRNMLLPVGTDYTPPNRWLTRIHREWAKRYVWPKFVTATARDYFDAVRRDVSEANVRLSPQTRDMNPIFTGCYVSYIDTKQAQRAAETMLLSAEKFSTIAALLGARYPAEEFDKAWRQLCFGAHHDGITGSESDQVYLDLMDGWRDAHDLSQAALQQAQDHLAGLVAGGSVVVFNTCSWARTDVVWAEVTFDAPGPIGVRLKGPDGADVDVHIEHLTRHDDSTLASAKIAFVARDVPATGYQAYRLVPGEEPIDGPTWRPLDGPAAENEYYRVRVDPARGGAITSLIEKASGKQMLKDAGLGNEVLAYDEYANPPGAAAPGPWVTAPRGGPKASSADAPATVVVEASPIGQRITVRGQFPQTSGYVQEICVWHGVDRVDCMTRLDEFEGSDTMIRARFGAAVDGGLPISETAAAVTGRTFGFPNADFADAHWTLDYPANNWVAIGSTLSIRLSSGAARAVNVAELIVGDLQECYESARAAVVALVRRGVTATTSVADGSRYGALDVDSNLPDFRISVGGPTDNIFTQQVLDTAGPAYAAELKRQLGADHTARVWVPAAASLEETWQLNADLRDPRALPVLIVAGTDLAGTAAAMESLVASLEVAPVIEVTQPAELDGTTGTTEDYSFAVLNRGLPGFAVDTERDVYLGLLRSSTGWPSGVWIDPPRRTLPNGANFQTNNWSHTFSYSLVGHAGDWRSAGLVRRGQEFNNPLTTSVITEVEQMSPEPPTSSSARRSRSMNVGEGEQMSPEPPTSSSARRSRLMNVGEGEQMSLPQRLSFLSADGDGVAVAALKPRGNPLASQSDATTDPADGVVVRLVESHGTAARAQLRFFGGLADAMRTDLLEVDDAPLEAGDDGALQVDLDGFEITTVAFQVDIGEHREARPSREWSGVGATKERRARTVSPPGVLPVYAQYWRHNTGPAPTGNQPLTVSVTPESVSATGLFQLNVTVAAEHSSGVRSGGVRLELPAGWTADESSWEYTLAPEGWASRSVSVTPDADAVSGQYFVAARVADDRHIVCESVAAVDLLDLLATAQSEPAQTLVMDRNTRRARIVPAAPSTLLIADAAELEATWVNGSLELRPDDTGELALRLTNRALSEIRGEAMLVTPYAMWEFATPRSQAFTVPAAGERIVRFSIDVPPDARAGSWWALVKLGYFGRRLYTETVPVLIR